MTIDHATATRLAGRTVDGPLDPDERVALDEHVAKCAACRHAADAMRGDAAAIRRLDFGDAPPRVQVRVAAAAARVPGAGRSPVSVAFVVGVMVLLAAMVGAIAVGAQRLLPPSEPLLAVDARFAWTTEVVEARIADLAIQGHGLRFVGREPIQVHSDPGTSTYWTLEATWRELNREMRLYLYFAADDRRWWVTEVRTYDGAEQGDWTFYKPDIGARLGEAWHGDLALTGSTPGTSLTVRGLGLLPRPRNAAGQPDGRGAADGVAPVVGSLAFEPGSELACTLWRPPADAAAELGALGYEVEWHLQWTVGPSEAAGERRDRPPEGVIIDAIRTGPTKLVVFVAPAGDALLEGRPEAEPCPSG